MVLGSVLETCQALTQKPQRTVESDILIDALDRPRRCDAGPVMRITPPSPQTTTDHIFLDPVEGTPEVSANIVMPPRQQKLLRLDRRADLSRLVTEAKDMRRFRERHFLVSV
jgi:hypothetical protein